MYVQDIMDNAEVHDMILREVLKQPASYTF